MTFGYGYDLRCCSVTLRLLFDYCGYLRDVGIAHYVAVAGWFVQPHHVTDWPVLRTARRYVPTLCAPFYGWILPTDLPVRYAPRCFPLYGCCCVWLRCTLRNLIRFTATRYVWTTIWLVGRTYIYVPGYLFTIPVVGYIGFGPIDSPLTALIYYLRYGQRPLRCCLLLRCNVVTRLFVTRNPTLTVPTRRLLHLTFPLIPSGDTVAVRLVNSRFRTLRC